MNLNPYLLSLLFSLQVGNYFSSGVSNINCFTFIQGNHNVNFDGEKYEIDSIVLCFHFSLFLEVFCKSWNFSKCYFLTFDSGSFSFSLDLLMAKHSLQVITFEETDFISLHEGLAFSFSFFPLSFC